MGSDMFNIPYFSPKYDRGTQVNDPGTGGPGSLGHSSAPKTMITLSGFFNSLANFEGGPNQKGVPLTNNSFSGQINGTTIAGLQKG